MSEEQLTTQDKELLSEVIGYGSNVPESKHNVHTFLYNVVKAEDTTKLGVLTAEEIGKPENPVRALKFMRRFANDIMQEPKLAEFFNGLSEDITSTSLSLNGTLVQLAVTQKKELADVTKQTAPKKENKSWFKSKDKPAEVDPNG